MSSPEWKLLLVHISWISHWYLYQTWREVALIKPTRQLNARPQLQLNQWIFQRRPADVPRCLFYSIVTSTGDHGDQNRYFEAKSWSFPDPDQVFIVLKPHQIIEKRNFTWTNIKKMFSLNLHSVVLQWWTYLTFIFVIGLPGDTCANMCEVKRNRMKRSWSRHQSGLSWLSGRRRKEWSRTWSHRCSSTDLTSRPQFNASFFTACNFTVLAPSQGLLLTPCPAGSCFKGGTRSDKSTVCFLQSTKHRTDKVKRRAGEEKVEQFAAEETRRFSWEAETEAQRRVKIWASIYQRDTIRMLRG